MNGTGMIEYEADKSLTLSVMSSGDGQFEVATGTEDEGKVSVYHNSSNTVCKLSGVTKNYYMSVRYMLFILSRSAKGFWTTGRQARRRI